MKEYEKYIQFNKLNEYDDIIHLSTKKPFNFSKITNTEDNIKQEYEEIQNILDYKFIKIKKPIQTHTNIVKVLNEDNLEDDFQDVDGLITNLEDVALCVITADCQPIILYDPIKRIIGCIHSGWKGTLNKITKNAINLMNKEYNSNPSDIIACIAPSILKCCFEVDIDVVDMFKENFNNIDEDIYLGDIKEGIQKYYIDTININKKELLDLGLKEENIILSNICTMCKSDKYHSYRTDKDKSGRNLTLIAMKKRS